MADGELEALGVTRLPRTLGESLTAFLADEALTGAFGKPLVGSLRAVRESEIDLFEGATDEFIALASRWAH